MRANADKCIRYVLISEGSRYTNHPSDPGGPTKYGITLADVRRYLKRGATANDVRNLTKDAAVRIYKGKYWDALRCDELPSGLDYTIFDYGVNSGIGRSGKILRRVLEMDEDTWRVTDEVLKEVKDYGPVPDLIREVNSERLRFMKGLRIWRVFGRGWSRRVASVRAISLRMAGVSQADLIGILKFLFRPAFGPGKAMVSPLRVDLTPPSGFTLATALLGGLIAIRNRKVTE